MMALIVEVLIGEDALHFVAGVCWGVPHLC
jgi:hypothetical protein